MTSSSDRRIVRFGVFEVDFGAAELRKRGRRVKLEAQPFQVLAILVRRPGELVTRDELRNELWPSDTFVEFDHSLNTAVKKIRKALDDSPRNSRFVQTVPRQGYRFVAPVERIGGPEPVVWRRSNERPWVWAAGVCVVVVAVAGAVWLETGLRQSPSAEMEVVPLTSYPGNENAPSFSPDGNQVAFHWNGPRRDNWDIYVKVIGEGSPVRLTDSLAADQWPAWSPDGRWIAFSRKRPLPDSGSEVRLVPPTGGRERKVAELSGGPPKVAWSSDGNWLVVSKDESLAEPAGLFLLSIETGEKRRLTSATQPGRRDVEPDFSPDGRTLAFVRRGMQADSVWLLPLSDDLQPAGEPHRLTAGGMRDRMPVWSADGREIVYTSGSWPADLYRLSVSGSGQPRRLDVGMGALAVATARSHDRLAFTNASPDSDIWRIDIPADGQPAKEPEEWISSTHCDRFPQYSPDGQRIAFESARSGHWEIWVCDSNGSNPVRMTFFNGPMTGAPRWSPDSKYISFFSTVETRRQIFVIPAEGGQPRRLTVDQSNNSNASWSADWESLYVQSDRTGKHEIWQVPLDGGPAVQVSRGGGAFGQASPDGRFLYFAKREPGEPSVCRTPSDGGEAIEVIEAVSDSGNWTVTDEGIYFISPSDSGWDSRFFINHYNPANGETTEIGELTNPAPIPNRGISVSPDGRYLLYSLHQEVRQDLMLVENFR